MNIIRNLLHRSSHGPLPVKEHSHQHLRSRWHTAGASFVFLLVALACGPARGQALTNGALYTGNITANATNSHTFTANSGESVVVRVGQLTSAGYFSPWLRVYGPDGALLGSGNIAGDDAEEIVVTATNSGTFTVLVSDGNYGGYAGTGNYQLNYVTVPGSFVMTAGDEGGLMTNGTLNAGTIGVGDLDAWNFTANKGDSVVVRVGQLTSTGYFSPWLRVYGPDGALLGSGNIAGDTAEEIALTATNNGTFTVLVSDGNYGGIGGTGTYQLNYVTVPGNFVVSTGDEGGLMTNGTLNAGTIGVGDLDAWSFTANKGDSVVVRVGQLTSAGYFSPWLRVYGPDGALLGSGNTAGDTSEEIALTATNLGTFTVLVSDGNYGGIGGNGTYQLNYVTVPGNFVVSTGDEGGLMTNGTLNAGTIDVGDLDAWNFTANKGDSVVVRVGQLTSAAYFSPWLRVYGSDGVLVSSGNIAGDAAEEIALTVTNSGIFTVMVSDGNYGGIGGTGSYQISYIKIPGDIEVSPGDVGGILTNGTLNAGTIGVGDLDAWNFEANTGDNVILRMGALTSAGYFSPWLRVYGPNGALIGPGVIAGETASEFAFRATNSGNFTVLLSDGNYGGYGGTGTYQLSYIKAPGSFVVSPGDQGGNMTNGVTYSGTNSLGDLDVWSFYGTTGDSNAFRIWTTNLTPWLRLYGPSGDMVAQAFTANINNRTNFLSYVVTNAGTYTLVSSSYYVDQTGTYNLKQSRVPPDLIVPDTQVLNEGSTLSVTISAQDPDVPFQPLTFAPVSLPAGASFSQTGSTNASITWPTTETSGPSTNVIVASVTDVVNGKPFTRTNSFTVVVNELNVAPALPVILTQTVNELTTLTVTNTATDSDIPANALDYVLLNPPTGAAVDANGIITWTPTEAQGPMSTVITTVVTDSNPWAVNAQHLSTTNSFTVVVNEVNTPPVLPVISIQTVNELTKLTVTNTATDSDIPINSLSYSLINLPSGASIDVNGIITWVPTEAQGPSTNVIIAVVADSNPVAVNSQHLSTTNTFTVVVNEVNSAPALPVIGTQTVNELTTLTVTNTATDSDVPVNPPTYMLLNPPTGAAIDSNGVITWTPTEAQGPSTNVITTVVTDTNAYAVDARQLSATNTFTVVVNEVNTAPVLPVIAIQTVNELTTLTVTNTATDSDIPANPLTYMLLNPPTGAAIDPNGVITWVPTEAQGPSTNVITTVVTDTNAYAVDARQLSATNTFTVVVNEVNTAPVLPVIGTQTVNELTTLTVTNTATDSDAPANPLTYMLLNPPTGAAIDANGVITWTPTEAQGPSTNVITTVVTDTNAYAVNARQMSATNTFTVVVNEANTAPVLQSIADRSIHYGLLLSVEAVAEDSDIPTNTLAFSLMVAPNGMTIDANSGLITWTPALAQFGSNIVTVKVTDNGEPPLSDTATFHVFVTGDQPQLGAQPLPGRLVQLNIIGGVGVTYELQVSTNMTSWDKLTSVTPTSSTFPYIYPASSTLPLRFYRLKLSQ